MDALALLCNLLAEGPATLRVLRREGVRTVIDVGSQSPERLASILGVSAASARRFAGEARMLAIRMGTAPLEREEEQPVEAAIPASDSPVREPPRFMDPSGASREATAYLAPGVLLRPRLIEGLDAELCDSLARQQIRTAEDLGEACGLNLARRLGLSLPRLLDFAYLARRFLAEAGTTSNPMHKHIEREGSEAAFVLKSRHESRDATSPARSLVGATREADRDVAGPFV